MLAAQADASTWAERRAAAAADPASALSLPRPRNVHTTRSTTSTLRRCSRCCLGRRPPLRARTGAAYWVAVCSCIRCAASAAVRTAQSGREQGQSPTYPETSSFDTDDCLPTTRHCKHPGCSRLVCDPCAQRMCPDGGNENDYHLCARHKPTEEEDAAGDSDSSDPFAFRPTGLRWPSMSRSPSS